MCVKTITIHVPEETYAAFQDRTSELIREAMSEYARRHFPAGTSVFDHEPAEVGTVIRRLDRDDELLGEMLG